MKITKILGTFALCAMLVPAVSCSKDDDGPDGGGSGSGGQYAGNAVVDIDGEKITEISIYSDEYTIKYDSEGRVSEITSRYGDNFKINYSDNTYTSAYDDESGTISFNADGYISQMTASWEGSDGDWYEKGQGNATFNYTNGYLTSCSITSSGSETDLEDNTTESWDESTKGTLTWTDGKLTFAKFDNLDHESDGDVDQWTNQYTYAYSTTPNKYNQFPVYMFNRMDIESDFADILAGLGLFGKGPSYFPVSCTETQIEEGSPNWDYTTYFSYDLNSNGSIDVENSGMDNDSYPVVEYTYGASSKASRASLQAPAKKHNKIQNIFRAKKHSK